jgi:hypothetical protein
MTDDEVQLSLKAELNQFNAGSNVAVGYLGARAGRVFLEADKMPSTDERAMLKTIIGRAAEDAHSINYAHPGSGEIIGSDSLTDGFGRQDRAHSSR